MKTNSRFITTAKAAIAAIVTYQLLLIVLILLRPDLDPYWHTISEWAIGPYGWLMTIGFMLSSISYCALFWTVRTQISGVSGWLGIGTLLICSNRGVWGRCVYHGSVRGPAAYDARDFARRLRLSSGYAAPLRCPGYQSEHCLEKSRMGNGSKGVAAHRGLATCNVDRVHYPSRSLCGTSRSKRTRPRGLDRLSAQSCIP